MELNWNKEVLDLEKLHVVTRGNPEKLKQYLLQFVELIPVRTGMLRKYLKEEDRNMMRQTVHQVSPQLHYFGLKDVAQVIQTVEQEYTSLPMEQLKTLVLDLIHKMETAEQEVSRILENYD